MSKEKLEQMKVAELQSLCKEKGISFYKGKNRMTKSEIVEKLYECQRKELSAEKEEQKKQYVENADIGVLVAFYDKNGKPRTGKIIKKNVELRRLKIETEFGAQFVIPYEDVMWVRYGERWPKGVFEILKGKVHKNAIATSN